MEMDEKTPPLVWMQDQSIASAVHSVKKLPDVIPLRLKFGLCCDRAFPSAEGIHCQQWAMEIALDFLENDAIAFECRDSMLNLMKLCKDVFHLELNVNKLTIRNRKHNIKLFTLPLGLPYKRYEKLVRALSMELNLPPFESTCIVRVDPLTRARVAGIIRRFHHFRQLISVHSSIRGLVTYLQVILSVEESGKRLIEEIEAAAEKTNRRYSRTKWRPIVLVFGDPDNPAIKPFYEERQHMAKFGLGEEEKILREFLLLEVKLEQKLLVFAPFEGINYQMKEAFLNSDILQSSVVPQLIREMKKSDEERLEALKELRQESLSFVKEYLMKCLLVAADVFVDAEIEESKRVSLQYLDQKLSSLVTGGKPITLIVDYDGTLVPLCRGDEVPAISAEAVTALRNLAKHPRIHVVLVSGRDPNDLRDLVGVEEILYIGNHGFGMLYPNGTRWDYSINKDLNKIIDLMEDLYTEVCVNGAYITNHGATLIYHYRHVIPTLRKSLYKKAWRIAKSHDFEATSWNRSLELRLHKDKNKGDACKKALEYFHGDGWMFKTHVIYVGDHATDEAVMRVLGSDTAITAFRVTKGHFPKTLADIQLYSHHSVLRLLQWLSDNVPQLQANYSLLSYY